MANKVIKGYWIEENLIDGTLWIREEDITIRPLTASVIPSSQSYYNKVISLEQVDQFYAKTPDEAVKRYLDRCQLRCSDLERKLGDARTYFKYAIGALTDKLRQPPLKRKTTRDRR